MTERQQNEASALIERALSSDESAVDALVERLMPIVRARVFRAMKRTGIWFDLAELDDRVQEVWIGLFSDGGRRLRAYDPSRGASLEHFVGVLAEREVAMLERASRAHRRGGHLRLLDLEAARDVPAIEAGPQEHAVANQLAERLGEHLVHSLPDTGRLVLRYAFKDGEAPPQVARILGVDVQVVYNWQHKIRRLAKEFLGD